MRHLVVAGRSEERSDGFASFLMKIQALSHTLCVRNTRNFTVAAAALAAFPRYGRFADRQQFSSEIKCFVCIEIVCCCLATACSC